jgi:hypothetical protein
MKPLLSAPLTDEDIDIWVTVLHVVGWPLVEVRPLLHPFFDADRRDAELMLIAQQMRVDLAGRRIAIVSTDWVDLGGELM